MLWSQIDNVLTGIPEGEELVLAGDLNGHVGKDRAGVERWHGGWTLGRRNEEGERVLEML